MISLLSSTSISRLVRFCRPLISLIFFARPQTENKEVEQTEARSIRKTQDTPWPEDIPERAVVTDPPFKAEKQIIV